jgi:hypothetical protein
MKSRDQLLLEQAYQKIVESDSVLVPRRSKEERTKNHARAIQQKIQQYIKNGSQGDLDLGNSPVDSLPQGLKVGGFLILDRTKIASLPRGLEVQGDLFMTKTRITSLPDDLKVHGSLFAPGSLITTLPDGLEIGVSLNLSRTLVTSLPRGLKVGNNLIVREGCLATMPQDLKVGNDLVLVGTPLAKHLRYEVRPTPARLRQLFPGVIGKIKLTDDL